MGSAGEGGGDVRDGPRKRGWVTVTTCFPGEPGGHPSGCGFMSGSWNRPASAPGAGPARSQFPPIGAPLPHWPLAWEPCSTCSTRSTRSPVRRATGQGLRACQTRPVGWRGGGRRRPLKGAGLSPCPPQPLGAVLPPAPQLPRARPTSSRTSGIAHLSPRDPPGTLVQPRQQRQQRTRTAFPGAPRRKQTGGPGAAGGETRALGAFRNFSELLGASSGVRDRN